MNIKKLLVATCMLLISVTSLAQSSGASSADKARKLYMSLTGTNPSRAEIDVIKAAIDSGSPSLNEVAMDIVDSKGAFQNYGAFYNVTVKNFAMPWTNEDGVILDSLNDLVATVIGYTRDELPFNEVLWQDRVYKIYGPTFMTGQAYVIRLSNGVPNRIRKGKAEQSLSGWSDLNSNHKLGETDSPLLACKTNASGYTSNYSGTMVYMVNPDDINNQNNTLCQVSSITFAAFNKKQEADHIYSAKLDATIPKLIKHDNTHYETLERLGPNLGDSEILKESTQLVHLHTIPEAVSGIMTTRAFGKAFFSAGTNRAPVAFAMKNFLCNDMEQLNATNTEDTRIRKDIPRNPGGDASIFRNRCAGCHAGMDGLSGAFAYYDWTGGITYNYGTPAPKMNQNEVFADGFATINDSWVNFWSDEDNPNASLGWPATNSGNGVQSLGKVLSETTAFSSCMSKQVFQTACQRSDTSSTAAKTIIERNATKFKNGGFNLKKLFTDMAIDCMESTL